jgi:HK97 family phage prohead protease
MCVRSVDFDSRPSDDGRTLEGYAAVFDSPTRIRGWEGDFEETIRSGAFKRSIEARMPVLQFDHGKDARVGSVPIGAIEELKEDHKGLFVRARLYDNPVVEPVRQAIAGGSIRGMSFRFEVPEGGDTWTRSGSAEHREIRDADVHELGPVVFPAYDHTSVTVRSLLAQLDPGERDALVREVAELLRADLPNLAGRPAAGAAGGGEPGTTTSGDVTAPQPHLRQRLDDGALRARGILL